MGPCTLHMRFWSVLYYTHNQEPQSWYIYAGIHSGFCYPKGPSTQILGFQGPETIQSMDFGT